jgi:hypothetical protein
LKKDSPNNCFKRINPLARFVHVALLFHAQSAPSPSGTGLPLNQMLDKERRILGKREGKIDI